MFKNLDIRIIVKKKEAQQHLHLKRIFFSKIIFFTEERKRENTSFLW